MTLQTLLRKAMEDHKAGDVESAKAQYEQILSQTPNDADALNLLGVLSLQCGNLDKAHDLIQRAIDVEPKVAEYHYNLGQVFKKSGNLNSARACFRKSMALDPDLEIVKDRLNAIEAPNTGIQPHKKPLRREMKRYEVVQHVIDRIKGRNYLEIGVNAGESFINTRAARKIGVDPVPTSQLIQKALVSSNIDYFSFSTTGTSKASKLKITARATQTIDQFPARESSEFFYMTSDSFFEKKANALFQSEKVDVAFIDGLHTHEQSCRDVLNVLDHLNDRGVILMHDCNPPTFSSAAPAGSLEEASKLNLPGWNGQWCGDVWKSIVYLRSIRNDLSIFVLDCDFGIGVVSKAMSVKTLNLTADQINAMTYKDLNADREGLLNLKPQEYLFEFLAAIGWCQ